MSLLAAELGLLLLRGLRRPGLPPPSACRSCVGAGRTSAPRPALSPPGRARAFGTAGARRQEKGIAVEGEALPSHSHSRRSDVSKRMQAFMDDMLARAAVAGQRVNTYTGTDYSGIERLRQQIVEQERLLRARLATVEGAKAAYTDAHRSQGSSQKEVVSLLERKTSWSPSDLDRYTSLIRSEHLHEQSVTSARQELASAERDLEEARTDLERKERRQYHEEQIWSDTIRRNSTWVTFGLMGLNILLLVANIGIVEPWRRRRLVREVKDALDQQTVAVGNQIKENPVQALAAAAVASNVSTAVEDEPLQKAEEQVDEVTEAESTAVPGVLPVVEESEPGPPHEPVAPIALQVEASSDMIASHAARGLATAKRTGEDMARFLTAAWQRTREITIDWWRGPLSDDQIVLRKVELTSAALEATVAGMALMGCISVLLRSM